MMHFDALPEFEKEKKKLAKKLPSLAGDLTSFAGVLRGAPISIGKNFTIIHYSDEVQIVKARLACRSLRDRSLRIIYAYHADRISFIYIELYQKSQKEHEDRKRIEACLQDRG